MVTRRVKARRETSNFCLSMGRTHSALVSNAGKQVHLREGKLCQGEGRLQRFCEG